MKTCASFFALAAASVMLAACGGGGSSHGSGNANGGGNANAATSFNTTVRTLAISDASPDATPSEPLDINAKTFQFDEDENAFADLFQ